jgi:dual specificity tyrosine-phosphorylation-regulated kinase 2/3/4
MNKIMSAAGRAPQNHSGHVSQSHASATLKAPAQQKNKEKAILLSDQEKQQFGNRCPEGFKKISILGKGGIALVWLGESKTG